MSEATQRSATANQRTVDYDRGIAFLGSNIFKSETYASQGAESILPEGTVMGKINASGEVVELDATASDGSQYPYGILASPKTVAAGSQPELSICVSGEVDKSAVSFKNGETFATVVAGRRLDDRIGGDTQGVNLVDVTEHSALDN